MSVGCNTKQISYGDPTVSFGSLFVPYGGEVDNVQGIEIEDGVQQGIVRMDQDVIDTFDQSGNQNIQQDGDIEAGVVDNNVTKDSAILEYNNVEQFEPNIPIEMASSSDDNC